MTFASSVALVTLNSSCEMAWASRSSFSCLMRASGSTAAGSGGGGAAGGATLLRAMDVTETAGVAYSIAGWTLWSGSISVRRSLERAQRRPSAHVSSASGSTMRQRRAMPAPTGGWR
eukprot:5716775-Prymnesium_polylepis.1